MRLNSDSHSQKSLSSLESDMAAKLAQPDLVPPDVISNRYFKVDTGQYETYVKV